MRTTRFSKLEIPWKAPNFPFKDLILSLSFGPEEFSSAYRSNRIFVPNGSTTKLSTDATSATPEDRDQCQIFCYLLRLTHLSLSQQLDAPWYGLQCDNHDHDAQVVSQRLTKLSVIQPMLVNFGKTGRTLKMCSNCDWGFHCATSDICNSFDYCRSHIAPSYPHLQQNFAQK